MPESWTFRTNIDEGDSKWHRRPEWAAEDPNRTVILTGRTGRVRFASQAKDYTNEEEATIVMGQRRRILSKTDEVEEHPLDGMWRRTVRIEVEFLPDAG